MSESIFKTPPYDYVVWEATLSMLVRETYGKPYFRLSAMLEAHNGSFHTFTVGTDSDDEWEAYAREELDLWVSGRAAGVDTEVLFWDMCRRGVAPAGRWLVEVWW